MPLQAVGYIRVSTNEQAMSGLSLTDQRRKIEGQAMVSDLQLAGVLEDAGESAGTLKRPAMTELLARIDGGQVDVLIIAKLDRLTRSVKDLQTLLERLSKAKRADGGKGVDLISTAESLDTGSAGGRLLITILAAVAAWEREANGERVAAAMALLTAQGKTTGTPLYGYGVDEDGNLVENADEQAVLARIQKERALNHSWQKVAEHLTAAGIRTRRGTAFSRQGIFAIAKKAGLA